jgi:hypothetical protein
MTRADDDARAMSSRRVRPWLESSDDVLRGALPARPPRAAHDGGPMHLEARLPSIVTRLFGRPAPRQVTRWYSARVRQGATREFPCGGGRMTVHCRNGEAWITHDGDPRDVVLLAQQSYTADRGERLTLHALKGDCVVEIQVDL